MIVVCNSTPLIGLAAIGRFVLLRRLFGRITIAQAVWDETVTYGRTTGGAQAEVRAADWITTAAVQDRLAVRLLLDELDRGEAETIVLAMETGADWVLMDERKGRRKLTQLGLNKIGTLGILVKAKQDGLIPAVRPDLERLRQVGFSVSDTVAMTILESVGE